jgi:hypothetical protein
MWRIERDPERGRAAAAKLKALGVKGILIKAAEQGYITQLACKMPECFCPEELGGACYFEPVTNEWSDWRSDWMPTLEHFPVSKKEGGKAAVDNAILAHRLCNRLDHSLRVGRSHGRDLERIRKAREEGIRRNNVQIGNTEGGEIPTVEAEAATPKPMKTNAPEWKSLPDAEKTRYLLDHQTISDRTWTDEPRLKAYLGATVRDYPAQEIPKLDEFLDDAAGAKRVLHASRQLQTMLEAALGGSIPPWPPPMPPS